MKSKINFSGNISIAVYTGHKANCRLFRQSRYVLRSKDCPVASFPITAFVLPLLFPDAEEFRVERSSAYSLGSAKEDDSGISVFGRIAQNLSTITTIEMTWGPDRAAVVPNFVGPILGEQFYLLYHRTLGLRLGLDPHDFLNGAFVALALFTAALIALHGFFSKLARDAGRRDERERDRDAVGRWTHSMDDEDSRARNRRSGRSWNGASVATAGGLALVEGIYASLLNLIFQAKPIPVVLADIPTLLHRLAVDASLRLRFVSLFNVNTLRDTVSIRHPDLLGTFDTYLARSQPVFFDGSVVKRDEIVMASFNFEHREVHNICELAKHDLTDVYPTPTGFFTRIPASQTPYCGEVCHTMAELYQTRNNRHLISLVKCPIVPLRLSVSLEELAALFQASAALLLMTCVAALLEAVVLPLLIFSITSKSSICLH